MSGFVSYVAGGATQFHAVMLAAAITGTVLAVSAGDLGPFAPMLVALGICAVLFSLVAETLFFVARGTRWLMQRRTDVREA